MIKYIRWSTTMQSWGLVPLSSTVPLSKITSACFTGIFVISTWNWDTDITRRLTNAHTQLTQFLNWRRNKYAIKKTWRLLHLKCECKSHNAKGRMWQSPLRSLFPKPWRTSIWLQVLQIQNTYRTTRRNQSWNLDGGQCYHEIEARNT